MEDKKNTGGKGGGDDLLVRLNRLETCLADIERTRKQRSLIGIAGLVLILLALAIFAANLWGFAMQMMEPESQAAIMSKVQEDMTDLLQNDPEIKMLVQDMQEDVLPYIAEQVTSRLKEELPAFREQGEEILANLQAYLEKDAKDKLGAALADVLAEIEQKLIEKYPQVTPDELQAVMATAQTMFIEDLTTLIERKLDVVADDLGNLKESVDQFKETPEYRQLVEDMKVDREGALHKVQLAMIEHMLELVIYHINPERGNEPAAQGGLR
jgi:molybdopterin converting factor small subunit